MNNLTFLAFDLEATRNHETIQNKNRNWNSFDIDSSTKRNLLALLRTKIWNMKFQQMSGQSRIEKLFYFAQV